jgi:hypothetical protein
VRAVNRTTTIRTTFNAQTNAAPARSQAKRRAILPRTSQRAAIPTTANPMSPFTPEQALATLTTTTSPPCGTTYREPSDPITGVATCVHTANCSTALAVDCVNEDRACSSNASYGSGQASSRKRTGKPSGISAREPNSSTTTAAANSGSVSKSMRIAQKYFDQSVGPAASRPSAAAISNPANA